MQDEDKDVVERGQANQNRSEEGCPGQIKAFEPLGSRQPQRLRLSLGGGKVAQIQYRKFYLDGVVYDLIANLGFQDESGAQSRLPSSHLVDGPPERIIVQSTLH